MDVQSRDPSQAVWACLWVPPLPCGDLSFLPEFPFSRLSFPASQVFIYTAVTLHTTEETVDASSRRRAREKLTPDLLPVS